MRPVASAAERDALWNSWVRGCGMSKSLAWSSGRSAYHTGTEVCMTGKGDSIRIDVSKSWVSALFCFLQRGRRGKWHLPVTYVPRGVSLWSCLSGFDSWMSECSPPRCPHSLFRLQFPFCMFRSCFPAFTPRAAQSPLSSISVIPADLYNSRL